MFRGEGRTLRGRDVVDASGRKNNALCAQEHRLVSSVSLEVVTRLRQLSTSDYAMMITLIPVDSIQYTMFTNVVYVYGIKYGTKNKLISLYLWYEVDHHIFFCVSCSRSSSSVTCARICAVTPSQSLACGMLPLAPWGSLLVRKSIVVDVEVFWSDLVCLIRLDGLAEQVGPRLGLLFMLRLAADSHALPRVRRLGLRHVLHNTRAVDGHPDQDEVVRRQLDHYRSFYN